MTECVGLLSGPASCRIARALSRSFRRYRHFPAQPRVLQGGPYSKQFAKALRMPSLEEMAAAVGEDEDVYLIDVDVPSLYPHTSVTYTKNFHKRNNSDGTAFLSTQPDSIMLLGSLTRTTTRLGEILKEVLDIFPDGALQFDAEAAAGRLADVVRAVRGYCRSRERLRQRRSVRHVYSGGEKMRGKTMTRRRT